MIRLLKIALIAFVAAFCLMYAVQNLVNLQAAYGFVALMAGMENHLAYPAHFGPPINSPVLIWVMLGIIVTLELIAGLLALKGVADLWKTRNASADVFNKAKKYAILGCGVAVLIWFGIFMSVGGAYFQMWQTPAGISVLGQAFQFAAINGLVLLIVNTTDQ